MTDGSKRATAADVARRSGVSSATVSYVLNATPGQTIPSDTRERVLAAADALGYVPSPYAQALARGRSRVAILDFSEVPFGQTISAFGRELAGELERRGFLPIVDQPDRSAGPSHDRLLSLTGLLAPSIVVTATALPDRVRRKLASAGVTAFGVLLPGAAALTDVVADAGRAQADYLFERGHRAIAYAGTSEEYLSALDGARRRAVLDRALERGVAGIDLGSHADPGSVQRALEEAWGREHRPTAVAAYNDETALLVLSAARRAGLRIPDDLAVIGVDDTPLARATYPTLTSVVASDGADRSATDFIDCVLSGAASAVTVVPRIVRRESA